MIQKTELISSITRKVFTEVGAVFLVFTTNPRDSKATEMRNSSMAK